MIAASVGFQCPDDVRAGQQGVRQARTRFGGAVSANGAAVTLSLVALNALVYLVQLTQPDLVVRFGNLALASDGGELIGVAEGQYYRLLTAAFLHANLFHLLTNMFALFTVGPQLEAALGRARFLTLYLLGALGGSTLSYLLSGEGEVGVGASGAIFALFGAFYVVVRRTGGETGPLVGLIVINIVITFAVPIIDWRAHLGGLATGALVGAAFAYAPRGPRRTLVQAGGCALVAAVLVLAVALRTEALAL
jgi:membrane associated rhomboid family serine protease